MNCNVFVGAARAWRAGCFVAAVAVVGLATTVAHADIIYGSTGGDNSTGGGRIYRIDTVAQTMTLVANTGFGRVGGIAFDASETLYAVAGGSAGPATLMTVDVNTGATSVIGTVTGVQGVDALAFQSDGTLRGGAWTGGGGALVTINPATGAVTGSLPLIGTGNSFVAGLEFASDGTLYGSRGNAGGRQDDFVVVNMVTGVLTALGPQEHVISDLAFGLTGTLYGSRTDGAIFVINPANGTKTFLFSTGLANLSGLTGVIPAPGSLALLGLGLLAGARRRR